MTDNLDIAPLIRLVEGMPLRCALVDLEHRYIAANQALIEHMGRTRETIIGTHVREVIGDAVFNVMLGWEAQLMAGQTMRMEGWVPYGKDAPRYIHQSVMPYRDNAGTVVAFLSITEDLTALKAAQQRAQSIVDSALDAVIVINEAGLVQEFNPAAERIFGHAREAVMGRAIGEIIVPQHLRAAHAAGFSRYLSTGVPHVLGRRVELEALHAQGHHFPVELAVVELQSDSGRMFAAHLRDLSPARDAAAEIAAQRERIHQIEKLSAMGSLLAGVAHELNNPLAILLAQATLLREKAADDDVRRRAERIEVAAGRAGRIVKSFLAMARQKPPQRTAVDIAAVLDAALDMTAYGRRSSGIALHTEIAAELPAISGDSDLLGQVVANLLINAQQALAETPGARAIRVSIGAEADGIGLEVADNGPGIPDTALARIFDPYFTTKPVGVGTGIGLSICRNVIDQHGGRITAGRAPEGGALFRLWLPLGDAGATVAKPTEGSTPRLAVLIVDDEPDVAESLAEVLAADGHHTRVVTSGEAALAAMRAERFDAVFADLRMPGMDGAALAAAIAEQDPRLGARVTIVTGDTVAGPARLGEGVPMLEKPFLPADVRAALRRLMGH